MTTLNLTKTIPTMIQNVITDNTVKQISVTWDKNPTATSYDVLRNTTSNDISAATVIANTETNSFIDNSVEGIQGAYYWVRGVSPHNTAGYPSDQMYDERLGINFNSYKWHLFVYTTAAATISIQYVRGQAWWTNADGSPGTSGLIYFTTPVTQTSYSPVYTDWVNPDYSRLNDSQYATVTTTGIEESEDLLFPMSDFGMPNDARLVGIQFSGLGKTTNHADSYIRSYLQDADGTHGWMSVAAQQIPYDNTDVPLSVGSSTTILGQGVEVGTLGSVYSIFTVSTSSGSGSGSVSSFGAWHTVATPIASFTPVSTAPILTNGSMKLLFTHGCTGDQTVSVDVKIRLRNVTDGVDFVSYTYTDYFKATASGVLASQSILPIALNTIGNTVLVGKQYSVIVEYYATKTGTGSPSTSFASSSSGYGLCIYSMS